jgi:hypothetical protein
LDGTTCLACGKFGIIPFKILKAAGKKLAAFFYKIGGHRDDKNNAIKFKKKFTT